MNSNVLFIANAAGKKAVQTVITEFCTLAKNCGKKTTLVTESELKGEYDLAGANLLISTTEELKSAVEKAKSDTDFVLILGNSLKSIADVEPQATCCAELAAPMVALTKCNEDTSTLADELLQTKTKLASLGVYLLATIVEGPKVSRAIEDSVNAAVSNQGESPVYFLPKAPDSTAFARAVNTEKLANRLFQGPTLAMTPGLFELELAARARAAKQRIVLAEGTEERILRATEVLLKQSIAEIILLGDTAEIEKKAADLQLDIKGATLIDPVKADNFEDYANTYYELRKSKGVTADDAKKTMSDATVYATMMVKKGDADGMVSGAINTTAHTIRPALQFVKTKPGFSVVSSCFLMCLSDRVLVFGDCAVNPNPTAEQLAEIAITTANTAKAFGIEPRVAMLSYSTGSSGKGPDVDLVIEATKLAHEKDPELCLDGPLQYDAAIDPTVAKTKMPNSPVAGKATVFIFPNLTCGNNTYKAVQRACNAIAIGPVLQGLNKPVNDLSRGCLVADIINTVAITAVQAVSEK